MSTLRLEELKRNRFDLLEGLKANNAYEGLKRLLSEMYPKNAHFIYELLQNAEDVYATKVKFILSRDKLIFEHDGQDFTLENIDAITNVGQSLKNGNDLAIGKFGVGFKAVYAYTSTPEIHSGDYDFKIYDMFLPDDSGVSRTAQKHMTRFIFPFDLPTKPKELAEKEIEDSLLNLDETALLFINNIKSISFELSDGSCYLIKSLSNVFPIKFITEIEKTLPNNEKESTYWSKFSSKCPLYTESGAKFYDVSIAYKMNLDLDKQIFAVDSKLDGKVCISFPTDQASLLHFHINAPFAATVARDNIKYCEDNDTFIEAIAKLAIESLYYFKDKQMLDFSVYEALPTIRDFSSNTQNRYRIIADKVKAEFEQCELFVTENGEYKGINEVRLANKEMKTILTYDFVEKLYQKSWLPIVYPATRAEYFIDQFGIKRYTIEDFIDSLEKDCCFFDELFSSQFESEYFKALYYLFSQSKGREANKYSRAVSASRKTRNEILKDVRFIMCDDGKLHCAKDKLFLRTDYQPKHYLTNPRYVSTSLKNNIQQDSSIKQFLLSIGVQEMSEVVDMAAGLSNDQDEVLIVWLDILKQFREKHEAVLQYKEQRIFFARKPNDSNIYRVKANECCWSKEIAWFYKDKYIFTKECYSAIDDNIAEIKDIFVLLGGITELKVVEGYLYDDYPLFSLLNKKSREHVKYHVRKDYFIVKEKFNWGELDAIKENSLKKEALELWKLVLQCNETQFLNIFYQANSSAPIQNDLESSLVYYLKRTAWVPTKSGEYKCPYELSAEELLDEFRYEVSSVLLDTISEKPNSIVEQLKNKGVQDENMLEFAGLDCDIQEEALKIARQMQKKKKKTGKSLTELVATSDRSQYPENDGDDDYGVFHELKNIEKRRLKLEKEFDDRDELPTFVKKLKFVLEKPDSNEKTFVKNEYHSHCQLCGKEGILTAKGKRYFEAINIFNTSKLAETMQINFSTGWNTLCLCPNCAAKFKYSQLTISELIGQVESIDIGAAQSELIEIPITLENKPDSICFTKRHLLSLQVAINKLKEFEKEEN